MSVPQIQTRISILPQAGDEAHVRGYMGGTDADIPLLDLDKYGTVHLAFHDLDAAVPFLDTLADAASGLAAKIRLAQAAAQVQPQTVAGA